MTFKEFLKKYYNHIDKKGLNYSVNIPSKMIVDITNDDEWKKWKIVESDISKNDITNLEKEHNLSFPKSFYDILNSGQFLDIEIEQYTLFGINTLESIQAILSYLPQEMISKNIVPIGSINDGDFIAINEKNEIIQIDYDSYEIVDVISANLNDFITKLSTFLE